MKNIDKFLYELKRRRKKVEKKVVQGLEEMRKEKLNIDIFHCTEELRGY